MSRLETDPAFVPAPPFIAKEPAETLAYVTLAAVDGSADAVGVIDTDADSATYGQLVGKTDMPRIGDGLQSLCWNTAHPVTPDRYLLAAAQHSARIYVLDTQPNPRCPRVAQVIDTATIATPAGHAPPHAIRCGPGGIWVHGLAGPNSPDAICLLDPESYAVRETWNPAGASPESTYDFAWHLHHDTLVTSAWGSREMADAGLQADILMSAGYGHALHAWDLRDRRYRQRIELGEHQTVLNLRAAHDPTSSFGFAAVALSLDDLSAAIWMWHKDVESDGGDEWKAQKVIAIPAEPADPGSLPEILRNFAAVPPLITGISLSADDCALYVSCWGTGELRRYDVSNPFAPTLTGTVRLGGVLCSTPHPAKPLVPLRGGPQAAEISADGERVYVTSSLSTPWDSQFYPGGVPGWLARIDVDPDGSMSVDRSFSPDLEGLHTHQVSLRS